MSAGEYRAYELAEALRALHMATTELEQAKAQVAELNSAKQDLLEGLRISADELTRERVETGALLTRNRELERRSKAAECYLAEFGKTFTGVSRNSIEYAIDLLTGAATGSDDHDDTEAS